MRFFRSRGYFFLGTGEGICPRSVTLDLPGVKPPSLAAAVRRAVERSAARPKAAPAGRIRRVVAGLVRPRRAHPRGLAALEGRELVAVEERVRLDEARRVVLLRLALLAAVRLAVPALYRPQRAETVEGRDRRLVLSGQRVRGDVEVGDRALDRILVVVERGRRLLLPADDLAQVAGARAERRVVDQ